MITWEDFAKLKLKVGKIESVEDIPSKDKLYKIEVNIGETVTIVAGLKPYYTKEELLGKKVILLANLQPKKIAGIESKGMLLAAEKDGKIALLTVDKNIPEGADVT